ncbi:uncharacterized protein LOC116768232 isoform X2 [Danaus plexippus]|nr:uncharacterized protein LOC116768232 isoform X2 [Danaus plexippus]
MILRDGLENIRQYSFFKEDVEYTHNESKSKEKFDTAESITFSGCKKFLNQEIYYDNQTLDLQAKRTKAQTMEVDQGLGQFNNADQTFNSSGKTLNNLIISRPLYEKHKIITPKLTLFKIDNYWSISKPQDNLNKNMIESMKIRNRYSENTSTAKKLPNKMKQIHNKCCSLSKGDYKTTNSIKFNQMKYENIIQNQGPVRWIAPTLTDPAPERVAEGRLSLFHENSPYRSYGCQETFNRSRKIIPHYHEHPSFDEERSDRKNAEVARHQNHRALKRVRNFDSSNPLNLGHVNAIVGQNKPVDDFYIIDSNELHDNEPNNFNTNHIFDISHVNRVGSNSGVCAENSSIYKYIDSDFYNKKLIVENGGRLINQRPEIFRSLDEERSLYQFNSSWEHDSIFSPFFLTSLDCNVYDVSKNSQNFDLFPITSSESMIYNNVNVESISRRSNVTYLEQYMNFLKDLNRERL